MDNPDPEIFGPLARIRLETLVELASQIVLSQGLIDTRLAPPKPKLTSRLSGSYNICHIVDLDTIKLVIRVPATGWGSGLTQDAANAMESQVATMRLIREKTAIPVPEVFALDTTDNNPIGAPYICMSFIPGKLVSKIWFDGTLARQEQVRLEILTNLARIMAQFSTLNFDAMGSFLPEQSPLGPIFDWEVPEEERVPMQIRRSGPFHSLSAFLDDTASKQNTPKRNKWRDGQDKILAVLRGCFLEAEAKSGGGFVLRPPDFDSQNVFADEHGNITGLIDWDLAHTFPRCLGFAAYPG